MCFESLCNNYQYCQQFSKLALDFIVNSGVQHHSTQANIENVFSHENSFETDVIFRAFLICFGCNSLNYLQVRKMIIILYFCTSVW